MDGLTPEEILLQTSRSNEIMAVFRSIGEAEVNGMPRFRGTDCRELAKVISCRSYATSVLELCHLVMIADAAGQGRDRYEQFFWSIGLARPANFRGWIAQNVERGEWRRDGFTMEGDQVRIAYPDGEFAVSFARMPYLAVFAEFLLTALGYRAMDQAFQAMLSGGATRRSVSDAANGISRLVYDYLRDHLPTAQSQRKFRRLMAYLQRELGKNFDPMSVDDDAVFEFWREESVKGEDGRETADFRTYLGVFKSFVRLLHVLDRAVEIAAMEDPKSIGISDDGASVDPERLSETLDLMDEPGNPLNALQEPPADRIKFLNKQEMAALETLFESGVMALRLPLSFLRAEVFGRVQRRLIQALRQNQDDKVLGELIRQGPDETYEQRTAYLEDISAHISTVLLASVHALAMARSPEAAALMLRLEPDLDLSGLADKFQVPSETGDNVVMLDADAITDTFLNLLEDEEQVGDALADLMRRARAAYKANSRQGFKDNPARDAELCEGFAAGGKNLSRIKQQMDVMLERLTATTLKTVEAGTWAEQFRTDKDLFEKQFTLLYQEGR